MVSGTGGGDGLAYGVTAEEEAFETTLRALSMLAGMTTDPPDTAALQEAFDLLDGAATELGPVFASVGLPGRPPALDRKPHGAPPQRGMLDRV